MQEKDSVTSWLTKFIQSLPKDESSHDNLEAELADLKLLPEKIQLVIWLFARSNIRWLLQTSQTIETMQEVIDEKCRRQDLENIPLDELLERANKLEKVHNRRLQFLQQVLQLNNGNGFCLSALVENLSALNRSQQREGLRGSKSSLPDDPAKREELRRHLEMLDSQGYFPKK